MNQHRGPRPQRPSTSRPSQGPGPRPNPQHQQGVQRAPNHGIQRPQRPSGPHAAAPAVNVKKLWGNLKWRVKLLQDGERMPTDPFMYEPGLHIVRTWLEQAKPKEAFAEAEKIAKRSHAGGFLAFEFVKDYLAEVGQTKEAARAADKAAEQLKEHKKAVEREERRQNRRGRFW